MKVFLTFLMVVALLLAPALADNGLTVTKVEPVGDYYAVVVFQINKTSLIDQLYSDGWIEVVDSSLGVLKAWTPNNPRLSSNVESSGYQTGLNIAILHNLKPNKTYHIKLLEKNKHGDILDVSDYIQFETQDAQVPPYFQVKFINSSTLKVKILPPFYGFSSAKISVRGMGTKTINLSQTTEALFYGSIKTNWFYEISVFYDNQYRTRIVYSPAKKAHSIYTFTIPNGIGFRWSGNAQAYKGWVEDSYGNKIFEGAWTKDYEFKAYNISNGRRLMIIGRNSDGVETEPVVFELISGVTDIDINQPTVREFVLNQNYPNPFNPVTTISYQLPQTIQVELTVYNIFGQKVATLVNERQSPGEYRVQFNASSLPTGTYIYQLKAGKFAQTKKMILLK